MSEASEHANLDRKVYTVSPGQVLSMQDLLKSFRRHGVARVSDLHLKTGEPPIFRVDADLKRTNSPPLDAATMEALARSILTDAEMDTLARTRSVNSSMLVGGNLRIRTNAFFDSDGMAMAIRALDVNVPEVEDLGFPNRVWEDICNLRHGLVLVTGATGAGKSTTIASMLMRIAQHRACRIITLEDPVEYHLKSNAAIISQRAIGRDVQTWERGLRDCLREDPDIIFVGEMTDQESATWTMTAAETGHLVFSALHTRDAAGTITRLLDMYPVSRHEEVAHQLSLGLRYILAQKLLPRATVKGRALAMEILNCNYAISNLIRQLKPEHIYSVMQTSVQDTPEQRMTTLERTLANLVRDGVIDAFEAERQANHVPVLLDELRRISERD